MSDQTNPNPNRYAGWDCAKGHPRKCDMNCLYPIYGCAKLRELDHLARAKSFEQMAAEQADDYADYLKRCGGIPVSKIKP